MRFQRIRGGAQDLPVTSELIETHFATLGSDSSTMASIEAYISAAAIEIEDFASIALLTQEIVVDVQSWPSEPAKDEWWGGVREGPISMVHGSLRKQPLPVGPVLPGATALVTTRPLDGEDEAIAANGFRLEAGRYPELFARYGSTSLFQPLRISYTAGFGPSASSVPHDLRMAIVDHALSLYERRGDERGMAASLSPHAARIASRYKPVRL